MTNKILVLHGPNLNRLGEREPETYGELTLAEINERLSKHATARGVALEVRQSNHSGVLIDALHEADDWLGVVLNPGGLTHFDVALRDAVAAIRAPVIEVHLSNIHAREQFRQRSLPAAVAIGQISGLGWRGYRLAIDYLIDEFGGQGALGFAAGGGRA